jgi:hypothetical protein
MNAEIDITQRQLLEIYERKRAYLASKPTGFVEDLKHECQRVRFEDRFSIRAAAEINFAACILVLEARGR